MANTVKWVKSLDNTAVILTKSNDEKITLRVGDVITYDGRPDGVKIISFTSRNFESNPDIGPIGMTYLPWRKEEQRWAEPAYGGMRGDPRHIICSPVGRNSYGEHIHWSTVKLIPNVENFLSVKVV